MLHYNRYLTHVYSFIIDISEFTEPPMAPSAGATSSTAVATGRVDKKPTKGELKKAELAAKKNKMAVVAPPQPKPKLGKACKTAPADVKDVKVKQETNQGELVEAQAFIYYYYKTGTHYPISVCSAYYIIYYFYFVIYIYYIYADVYLAMNKD